MIQNPYLNYYSQSEISILSNSGSISSSFDLYGNLIIENTSSISKSSITIPLMNIQANSIKVESKYQVGFSEL